MKRTCTAAFLLSTLVVLASSVLVSSWAFAETPAVRGECIEDAKVYLKELRAIANVNPRSKSDRYYITSRLFCLYNDSRFTMASKYPDGFASVAAMDEIRSENKKNREACFKVIRKFLQSSREIRCEAITVLSYFGDRRAAALLISGNGMNPADKGTLLAVTGDRNAIPWIIKQYRETAALTTRNRVGDESTIIHRKKVYLNALFHLGIRAQLPFIEEVILSEKSDVIRERARLVKSHIEALYPN